MNANTFRLVFSKHLGMLIPVGEQTATYRKPAGGQRSGGRKSAAFLLNALALSIAAVFPAPTFALPTTPTVANGTASFNQAGNTLTVTNSNGAIINWQQFNIGAGETTHFQQASASSSVLNQVIGNNPSAIYGTLSSNGKVWLVNQAGIVVGAGAIINTAGFVASTLHVRAEDFLAGRLAFQATPGAGDVVNRGSITTPLGGSVYMVGANVANEGIITTPGGETILAAGNTVSLVDTATPGVKVEITGAAGNATNLGQIVAEAGRIGIAGSIVKNSGTLNASSVVSEGGRIFLKASQDTYVDGHGRIVATGTQGGQVEVLGNRVAVTDNAEIDASGTEGGGTILVGGDYQGKNPDIQNAEISYFGPNATLKANATEVGAGGTAIIWADDITRGYGTIEAKGAGGGAGGFVETSGKRSLDINGIRVDTGGGTWLLDPTDITIYASGSPDGATFSGGIFSGGSVYGSDSIGWDTINGALSSNNVVIQTASAASGTGNITIYDPGVLAGSAYSLSLLAENNIVFNNGVSVHHSGTGNLTLVAGWNSTSGYVNPTPTHATNAGNITFNSGSGLTTNYSANGNITLKAKGQIRFTDAWVSAGGNISIEAQSLLIEAVTGAAGIHSKGNHAISLGNNAANGDLSIISTSGPAVLQSEYGSQTITFNGSAANTLYLRGSDSGGGNYAHLRAGLDQSISHTAGSLAITLVGGAGSELNQDSYYEWPDQLLCTTCVSRNGAEIGAERDQSIQATSITITGGSNGKENQAGIEADGNSVIQVTGAITLNGGATGGDALVYSPTGEIEELGNDAYIEADGALTITAGSISLNGGGATYGGAYIGTDTGALSVTTSGNVTLIGGTSDSGIWNLPAAPAVIGTDYGGSVTLNVGGTLSLTGGAGSGAYVGSWDAIVPISIHANSGITLTSGANAAPVGIGSFLNYYYGYYYDGYLHHADGDIGIAPQATLSSNGNITLNAWGSIGMYGTMNSPGTVALTAGNGNATGLYYINIGGRITANTINATTTGGIWAYNYTVSNDAYYYYGPALYANTINLTSSKGGHIYADTASSGSINATIQSGSQEAYSWIGIYNVGNPTEIKLNNNNSVATHAGMWFNNVGDLTLGSGSQFNSSSGGYLDIWSSGLLTLNGLNLQRTASPEGYGGIWLGGSTGIHLSDTTLRSTASGALQTVAYDYYDAYGGDVKAGSYSYNLNGISLHSGGNITLALGSKIEAPNADVLLELWGANSALYIGKAGDTSPSYVLSKATTTQVEFEARKTADGIFINDVATTSTVAGGSGFFAGNLSTPATVGAGLHIYYDSVNTATTTTTATATATATNEIIKSTEPTVTMAPPPVLTPTDGGSGTPTNGSAGGGEGEFGGDTEGEKKSEADEEKNGDAKQKSDEEKQAKKKAAQCKG